MAIMTCGCCTDRVSALEVFIRTTSKHREDFFEFAFTALMVDKILLKLFENVHNRKKRTSSITHQLK